jgi:hypothetical protein
LTWKGKKGGSKEKKGRKGEEG